jgi:hypothetical protein
MKAKKYDFETYRAVDTYGTTLTCRAEPNNVKFIGHFSFIFSHNFRIFLQGLYILSPLKTLYFRTTVTVMVMLPQYLQ